MYTRTRVHRYPRLGINQNRESASLVEFSYQSCAGAARLNLSKGFEQQEQRGQSGSPGFASLDCCRAWFGEAWEHGVCPPHLPDANSSRA